MACPLKKEQPALVRTSSYGVFSLSGNIPLGTLKSSQRKKREREKEEGRKLLGEARVKSGSSPNAQTGFWFVFCVLRETEPCVMEN